MSKEEFEFFPGKSMDGLFKDIYDNQQRKKKRISELIHEMKKIIRHAGDMALIGPIIKDLVDTSVKNDEALIKMATIGQRIMLAQNKNKGDEGFLTEQEKEQLLQQMEDTIDDVTHESDEKVDDLTYEVDELKKKMTKPKSAKSKEEPEEDED